jgi:hypothetical protein
MGNVTLRSVAAFPSRHASENIAEVLKQRSAELPSPIQMCDAFPSLRAAAPSRAGPARGPAIVPE